ncbi:MAG TPA: hypothetical protein VFQ61_36190 [Polyangiaceae bacterium]|nr:hypothetical protein [Polyangiaceae bacterium]
MRAIARLSAHVGLLASLLVGAPSSARLPDRDARLKRLADAITEIDVAQAERLLSGLDSNAPEVAFESARLAIYRGDCGLARVILARPDLAETREGSELKNYAEGCARATAAGFVVEDAKRGIWLRVQDAHDRALAPLLFDVAARARDAITRQVGVDLPKPLRIDLVRDLFSLSAVSGLPLSAAETTGTLAVARWGKVILLSPRAAAHGFPWEDTLAHEITHLVVTRATRDHAPLWLQEGMAKRLETSWREPQPLDEPGWAEALAVRAFKEGRSVGIDKLGASIAMLPTPEAASIAFAEVTSFVEYFVRQAGEPALRLLFADLRGVRSPDQALTSVTGYPLPIWNQRWQAALGQIPETPERSPFVVEHARDVARRAVLSDLLLQRGHAVAALMEVEPTVTVPTRPGASARATAAAPQRDPQLRHRAARAALLAGDGDRAAALLGTESEIASVHGPWFGVRGRLLRQHGDGVGAERAWSLGIAADPFAQETACEGQYSRTESPPETLPTDPTRHELCLSTRQRPRD